MFDDMVIARRSSLEVANPRTAGSMKADDEPFSVLSKTSRAEGIGWRPVRGQPVENVPIQ
jgi:hypothetical protein